MDITCNPSSIGDINSFVRDHEKDAEHVCSSDYSHFYVIRSSDYAMGIRRSKTGYFTAYPVCWMEASRVDEVVQALHGAAKYDL